MQAFEIKTQLPGKDRAAHLGDVGTLEDDAVLHPGMKLTVTVDP